MATAFPLSLAIHDCRHDVPPQPGVSVIGVFDKNGYWAHFSGQPAIQWPNNPENWTKANQIVSCLNEAYYQGMEKARAEIRTALGIVQGDGE